MSDDVKFCKDCKFYMLTWVDRLFGMNRFGKCGQKVWKDETPRIDYLITGKKEPDQYYFASTMRTYDCGSDAKYYEPKE